MLKHFPNVSNIKWFHLKKKRNLSLVSIGEEVKSEISRLVSRLLFSPQERQCPQDVVRYELNVLFLFLLKCCSKIFFFGFFGEKIVPHCGRENFLFMLFRFHQMLNERSRYDFNIS